MRDEDGYRLEQGGGSLLETLNHALDLGVVVHGDVTLSLADIPLVYLGLNVLLSSTETIENARRKRTRKPERGEIQDHGPGPILPLPALIKDHKSR
jgi:hypothetical protein